MADSQFKISIPKTSIADLETVGFDGEITVIDTLEGVDDAVNALMSHKIVGFDTETKPCFHKGKRHAVALMQVSTGDHGYLFRLNKIGFPESLRRFVENPDIKKIGLSLKDDFFVMHRAGDFEPGGFIDLQKLVGEYHIADASLQRIYAIIFGKRISKAQRLTNWEAKELTPAQQMYATIDAWSCLEIYNYLMAGKFHPEDSPYIVPDIPADEQPAPAGLKPAPESKKKTDAKPCRRRRGGARRADRQGDTPASPQQ